MFPISKALSAARRHAKACAFAAASVLALGVISPAEAADKDASPGLEAIDSFRNGEKSRQAVENRFFLKQERFEISPVIGYVPRYTHEPPAMRWSRKRVVLPSAWTMSTGTPQEPEPVDV